MLRAAAQRPSDFSAAAFSAAGAAPAASPAAAGAADGPAAVTVGAGASENDEQYCDTTKAVEAAPDAVAEPDALTAVRSGPPCFAVGAVSAAATGAAAAAAPDAASVSDRTSHPIPFPVAQACRRAGDCDAEMVVGIEKR